MKRLGAANGMCGVASSETSGLPSSLTSPGTGPRVVVAVEAGRRVADVALDDDVTDRDLRVVDVGQDLADRREDATRDVVDQRVRPHVAGRVRQVAVAEGEDLALLGGAVGRIALRLPRLREDVLEPLAGLLGVDHRLAVGEVGEAVGADHAGVEVRAVGGQRGDDLGTNRVLAAVDRDLAVVGDVLPRSIAGLDVRVRLERVGGGRAEREREQRRGRRQRPTVAGDRQSELSKELLGEEGARLLRRGVLSRASI